MIHNILHTLCWLAVIPVSLTATVKLLLWEQTF